MHYYCVGTTVCIMSSQLCKQYHYKKHSVQVSCVNNISMRNIVSSSDTVYTTDET